MIVLCVRLYSPNFDNSFWKSRYLCIANLKLMKMKRIAKILYSALLLFSTITMYADKETKPTLNLQL